MGIRIHPTADVSPKAEIGEGTSIWHQAQVREEVHIGKNCIIGKGVYVDAGVSLGDNVKIQNYVSVYHGVTIENGVFVGPHVCFTNDLKPRAVNPDGSLKAADDWVLSLTKIGQGAALGANSTIRCGITVGEWAMIGSGSVVTRDIPDYGLAWGNPARLQGFVCACGERLEKETPHEDCIVTKCPACGTIVKNSIERLGANQMINIAKPQIGEEEKKAVLEVLDSGIIAQGPRVKAFEEAFAAMCGVNYAIATTSGTTALHVALLAHGIGEGDEVITSPFTFIASANSILYTGARPIFVDIDPATYNLDPTLIKTAITNRTKAIMPVHLFGLSCNMDAILEITKEYGLAVIEDACQSHNAFYKGKRAGSFGTGAFSFYPTKNMTSAEGGMITTDDSGIDEKCRVIRQHGMRRRYYHDELGFNFRMTDVHAAIGLEQLKKLPGKNQQRQVNARFLSENLHGVTVPCIPQGYEHVFHQYTVRVPGGKRDALRTYLQENGVGSEVYYPVPVHKQTFYIEQLGYQMILPHAEQASLEVLSLPVHPALSQADLETIVARVNEFMVR